MVTLISTIHSYAGVLTIICEVLEPVAFVLAIACMIKYLKHG